MPTNQESTVFEEPGGTPPFEEDMSPSTFRNTKNVHIYGGTFSLTGAAVEKRVEKNLSVSDFPAIKTIVPYHSLQRSTPTD